MQANVGLNVNDWEEYFARTHIRHIGIIEAPDLYMVHTIALDDGKLFIMSCKISISAEVYAVIRKSKITMNSLDLMNQMDTIIHPPFELHNSQLVEWMLLHLLPNGSTKKTCILL
jgi:hypothetical protein